MYTIYIYIYIYVYIYIYNSNETLEMSRDLRTSCVYLTFLKFKCHFYIRLF